MNAVEEYKGRRELGWYQSAVPLADAAIAELEAELATVKLRHDILIQADVVGHPPVQDICNPYPECETEWLAAIIAWLILDPTTDPDLLARWAARSTP